MRVTNIKVIKMNLSALTKKEHTEYFRYISNNSLQQFYSFISCFGLNKRLYSGIYPGNDALRYGP